MTEVIVFDGVGLRYRSRRLLDGVDFSIEQGRSYGLRGPNGSGKSAMLRLMTRIVRPTSGTVRIDDRFLDRRRVYPDRFGVAIDGPAYVPVLTGRQNLLELAAIRRRIGPTEIDEVMATFGLDPGDRTRVAKYSLGMKQKLSLCQVFMESPEVVLLDEPFNGLDSGAAAGLTARLEGFVAAGGTVVLTSHESAHLDRLTSTTLRIDGGTVHVEA